MSPYVTLVFFFTAVGAQTLLNLNNYLQPDRVTRDQFYYPPSSSNLCARECVAGAAPKTCYYKWTAEEYDTLGPQCGNCPSNVTACDAPQCVVANGFEKPILTINRMVPGPAIHVCLGDRIIIDIVNKFQARTMSIHWHGVFQQGSQYMDGVPMVTQCAVHEGDSFRYDFRANNEGTHYWHSHDGLQKMDGIQGNLVVRRPKSSEPNGNQYDVDAPEHTLMVMDWMNTTAEDRFPGLYTKLPGELPITFLLEGKGRPKLLPGQINGPFVPYKEVFVEAGRRFRLRLVGGLCAVCGVEVSIERHGMVVIATDGSPINPVAVTSLNIYSGERYDVVINANQTAGTYWIHMRGLAECSNDDEQIFQLAVLRYLGTNQARNDAPGYNGGFGTGRVLNPENATCTNTAAGLCVSQLSGSNPENDAAVLGMRPNVTINLRFGFKIFTAAELFNVGTYDRYLVAPDRSLITSWMNNISYVSAPSPILSQGLELPSSIFCPIGSNGFPQCPASAAADEYCECVHIIKIPLNAVVQIVVGDLTPALDLHHPFHLHGYDFYIMAIDQFRNGDTLESISSRLYDQNFRVSQLPPKKDTVAVPSNGYAAIRFRASNPGIWFFHCHFMYHLATGMAVVFQVGNSNNWPPVPPNFPRCGNYLPPAYS